MLIIALSTACFSTAFTQHHLKDLSQSLEIIYKNSESENEINLDEIYEKWNKCSMLLHLFINSNSISKVENSMDALRFYASNDRILFRQSCVDAITAINEITEIETVTFKNIF